ncbi:MAG: CinA family protein [Gemmatimonadota bacterium]|nr:CinA family protein [Gemmatimonadota bacterium]
MAESLEVRLCELMIERGWTLSVAETTTGGLICSRIVSVPGSSAFFERGLVPYSARAKTQALGLPESLLMRCGAVSGEVAASMAEAVGRTSHSTLGLAETGIAGPIRGRSPKPLGTSYIALWTPEGVRCENFAFEGDRGRIRERIAEQALAIVVAYLEDAA